MRPACIFVSLESIEVCRGSGFGYGLSVGLFCGRGFACCKQFSKAAAAKRQNVRATNLWKKEESPAEQKQQRQLARDVKINGPCPLKTGPGGGKKKKKYYKRNSLHFF